MRIAYFDCYSGISGDMCLGALVDAGAPFRELKEGLEGLKLGSFRLKRRRVRRGGISGTRIEVVVERDEPHRNLAEVRALIEDSALPAEIKKKGTVIFRRLFQAEAKVHGRRLRDVHLHELSGTDCIVDIVGTLICMDLLGIEEVHSSPLNLGGGTVDTGHGLLPVPAPATSELLRGRPVYSTGVPKELTTPTGAALMASMAAAFGPIPEMTIERIGYGAGGHPLREQPNMLRVFVGEGKPAGGARGVKTGERIDVIETNIDDMNPQIYEHLMERLLEEGALDVYLSSVIMKKNRPGVLLTVLGHPPSRGRLIDVILKETTTLGIRYREMERLCLERKTIEVETEFGPVRYKVAHGDGYGKAAPEYEDCRRIARKTGIPLVRVMRMLASRRR